MKQEGKPTQGMGKRLVAALSTLAMLVSLSPVALAEETAVLDESTAQVQQVDDPSSESDGPGAEVSDETRTSAEQENPESPATPETSEPATLAVQAEEAVEEVVEEDADLYQASAMLGGKNMADAGLTTISDTRNNVAEGVTYRKIITKNASGQNIGFLTEVDLSKHVKIKAAYNGYYTAGSTAASRATASKSLGWSFETPTKMAADYESTADHEGTVVMATNGDYFNMQTGQQNCKENQEKQYFPWAQVPRLRGSCVCMVCDRAVAWQGSTFYFMGAWKLPCDTCFQGIKALLRPVS